MLYQSLKESPANYTAKRLCREKINFEIKSDKKNPRLSLCLIVKFLFFNGQSAVDGAKFHGTLSPP